MLHILPDITSIAAEIDAARHARRAIEPPPELALLSVPEAYAVQDAVSARREPDGAIRSGWKLELTDPRRQRIMGVDRPIFGRIFAEGAVAHGSRIAHCEFLAPHAQAVLAFGLTATLNPDAHPTTYLRAVAWVAPVLEITDSRYVPGARSTVEFIADNVSAAAYVLGKPVSLGDAPRLDRIETQIARNGTGFASGTTADVLGNPLHALRLLVAHLAQRGLRVTAGDVILSGPITDAIAATPGDRVEVRLDGLDSAAVEFV